MVANPPSAPDPKSGIDPETGEWTPAVPGQRPPFAKGNTLGEANFNHLKSGAWSPRVVGGVAEELYAQYRMERPDLDWSDGTVQQLARAEARAVLLDRDLAENGMFDAKGRLRENVLREWRAMEKLASNLRHSLGWTPRSRAAIQRDSSLAVTPWTTPQQRQQVVSERVDAFLSGGTMALEQSAGSIADDGSGSTQDDDTAGEVHDA